MILVVNDEEIATVVAYNCQWRFFGIVSIFVLHSKDALLQDVCVGLNFCCMEWTSMLFLSKVLAFLEGFSVSDPQSLRI